MTYIKEYLIHSWRALLYKIVPTKLKIGSYVIAKTITGDTVKASVFRTAQLPGYPPEYLLIDEKGNHKGWFKQQQISSLTR
ncbi:hypothetical protein [Catenovulum maritimum]|uniref:Uncharacterized protein n=1 Tax=Catenovulum maritimum TaxID=1513271 RepID=A0A0J8JJ99_9ALTE|nr:hypothetical protein [Catenovulum maritimum]KMT64511.1 hypothetical protein XM47_13700 [Catenovulum maritimum]